MIVLDTNVISEIMLLRPERQVLIWLDRQPGSSIWITSINIFETRSGLQSMPVGRRRTALMELFERWLVEVVHGRIVNFDESAARRAAELNLLRKEEGRPLDSRDTMIAGIVSPLTLRSPRATSSASTTLDCRSSIRGRRPRAPCVPHNLQLRALPQLSGGAVVPGPNPPNLFHALREQLFTAFLRGLVVAVAA